MSERQIRRVYRRKEVAQLLGGISAKTVDRMISRGDLATVALTDRIVAVTGEEIDRFIAARTVGAA
jgi:predicted DNA-binding transcriptional regulator AlpA